MPVTDVVVVSVIEVRQRRGWDHRRHLAHPRIAKLVRSSPDPVTFESG
jgi:hypothetical protein